MEKKIATSVEVLIKVAQYESIRLTKYGEAKIEFDSSEERIEKEERLSDEVILDLVTTMRALPEKLGKQPNAVMEIEEAIQNRIPEWLDNGPVPNIADDAKKSCEKSEGIAHAENEVRKEKVDTKSETDSTTTEMEELFGKDEDVAPVVEEKVVEENTSDMSETPVEDFSDDEDLFA